MSNHNTKRTIVVVPYNEQWPEQYANIAQTLSQIIGAHLIDIHHIGSTSVPNLPAKPIIDVLVVVDDILFIDTLNEQFADFGCVIKGENGMPFRRFFYNSDKENACNIHIYQQGNPEISRHLLFRDYMIKHPNEALAYANLKKQLAKNFDDDIFSYLTGKENFVREIDRKSGYQGFRMVKALTPFEWQHYHDIRESVIFSELDIDYDSNHPTMTDPHHHHFVFFKDTEIIGVLQIELPDDTTAILRSIAIDTDQQNKGYGTKLYQLAEQWLVHQGKIKIKTHANPKAVSFYERLGYTLEDFPDAESINPDTIDMAKIIQHEC